MNDKGEVAIQSVSISLDRGITDLVIHTGADWHVGDMFCREKEIDQMLREVQTHDNHYLILDGDLANNATKSSVSDGYAEKLTPQQQLERIEQKLEPVKDKILLWVPGNHEYRTYKESGIDISKVAAMQLGILDRYCATGGLLFLRFGQETKGRPESNGSGKVRQICYTIYANHGSGGGRKEGAKAVRLADMASIVDADIYIHAHTHLPMIMKEAFYRTDARNSTYAKVDKLFVNTASSLDYGGYGEMYEFKPSSRTSPVLSLSGTHKEFNATL